MELIKTFGDWDLVKYCFGYEFINKYSDERVGIFATKKEALKEIPQ